MILEIKDAQERCYHRGNGRAMSTESYRGEQCSSSMNVVRIQCANRHKPHYITCTSQSSTPDPTSNSVMYLQGSGHS